MSINTCAVIEVEAEHAQHNRRRKSRTDALGDDSNVFNYRSEIIITLAISSDNATCAVNCGTASTILITINVIRLNGKST